MLPIGALLIFLPDLKLMKIWQGSFGSGVLFYVTSIVCHNLTMLTIFVLPKRYSAGIMLSCINITVLTASIHY